ncbi:hypothetical protein HMPREF1548_01884 [Clostridium sp. KLE 1755]|nr:hypothetical protein HMPREF1548_01884 [Clostridium sp. KLE 1755]
MNDTSPLPAVYASSLSKSMSYNQYSLSKDKDNTIIDSRFTGLSMNFINLNFLSIFGT